MRRPWLGIDIGGANLKAASSCGEAHSRRFALWKSPHDLPHEILEVIESFDESAPIAITMTGELADCFASKQKGVQAIVRAVEASLPNRQTKYYLTTGQFVDADQAASDWRYAAASNWHALATYVGTQHKPVNLLIDFGSTTCDIIPIRNGCPCGVGQTDPERILASELVYTGVDRSPVCSVLPYAEFRGRRVILAQEWFATMSDAYLLLGDDYPDEKDCETADGRPKSIACASQRMARMLCADVSEVTSTDLVSIARQAKDAQRAAVQDAAKSVIERMTGSVDSLALSGQGEARLSEWFSGSMPHNDQIRLSQSMGDSVSRCAPAFAVAALAVQDENKQLKV